MLRKSDGLHELGGLQLHSALCLLVAWLLVSLCLVRGVKSLGKVSAGFSDDARRRERGEEGGGAERERDGGGGRRQRKTETDSQSERQRASDRQTDRQRETDRQIDNERERETDRQTTNRQTDRQRWVFVSLFVSWRQTQRPHEGVCFFLGFFVSYCPINAKALVHLLVVCYVLGCMLYSV